MNAAPPISLWLDGRGAQLDYRPLQLDRVLRGMDADAALAMLPRLLPVCAEAQRVAATRALESASGSTESEAQAVVRGRELLREQGLAAAWRLLVDWPRWLGEVPRLAQLKVLRQGDKQTLAAGLRRELPPIDAAASSTPPVLPQPTTGGADVTGEHITARLLGAAAALGTLRAEPLQLLCGDDLWVQAQQRLVRDGNVGRIPVPVVVGPLAMARHPGITALVSDRQAGTIAQLLTAQWLDMLSITDALEQDRPLSLRNRVQHAIAERTGVGMATTARGPLYHLISIDGARRITDWRYIAPTDWHFAPCGVVATLAAQVHDPQSLRLLLAAADPCAACRLLDADGALLAEGS